MSLLDKLTEALRVLPGVGPKSAQRMAYHLLQRDPRGAERLSRAIGSALATLRHCTRCNTFTEDEVCERCASPKRDPSLLCIVEMPVDLNAMEQTHAYGGLYYVLMGRLSPLDGIGLQGHLDLRKGTVSTSSIAEFLKELAGMDLEIVVTDLEICMRNRIASLATETPGTVTVNARKLYEVIKELPDPSVELRSMENHWVEIRSGRSQFHIAGLPAQDFPTIPSMEDAVYRTVPERQLRRLLSLVDYAISTDETRYVLNGVFFEPKEGGRVRMVATDGHRLAMVDRELPGDFKLKAGVIIPRKGLFELKRLLDEAPEAEMQLGFAENSALFKKPGLSMVMRLIDGQFPDYQRVIPKESDRQLLINRGRFHDALKRIALLSSDKSNAVKLSLSENLLRITANNPEQEEAEEQVFVEYEGDVLEVGFNVSYLLDVTQVIEADSMSLTMADNNSSALIQDPNNNDSLYVVMPMRL